MPKHLCSESFKGFREVYLRENLLVLNRSSINSQPYQSYLSYHCISEKPPLFKIIAFNNMKKKSEKRNMDWNPSFTNWEHPPPLLLPDPLQQDLFCPWRASGTKWMSGISEKGHVELRAVMWDLTLHNTLVRCSGTCIKDQGCEKNWRRHKKAARGITMKKQTQGAKMWCF